MATITLQRQEESVLNVMQPQILTRKDVFSVAMESSLLLKNVKILTWPLTMDAQRNAKSKQDGIALESLVSLFAETKFESQPKPVMTKTLPTAWDAYLIAQGSSLGLPAREAVRPALTPVSPFVETEKCSLPRTVTMGPMTGKDVSLIASLDSIVNGYAQEGVRQVRLFVYLNVGMGR